MSEESEIEISKEQKEISIYAQQIISTIEKCLIKPKNIPAGLIANIRLTIRPSGQNNNKQILLKAVEIFGLITQHFKQ